MITYLKEYLPKKEMKTKLDMWMEFISQIDKEGVENAMSKNKEIKKAQEEYEYLTGEENERRIAFLMDKAIRDEKSAYVDGKKDGEKFGEQKKQREIAKKMKEEKVDTELIIKVTGLTEKQIEDL